MSNEPVYHFGEHPPADGLAGFVSCYWDFLVDGTDQPSVPHTIPPDGCINLVCVVLPEPPGIVLHLNGPRAKEQTIQVRANVPIRGVRFFPGATSGLFGLTGRSLFESSAAAVEEIPEIANRLKAAIPSNPSTADVLHAFDDTLLAAAQQARDIDVIVAAGVQALVSSRGGIPIEEIAQQLNISVRHFQRLFREEVGLTPKEFARIRRFRSAAIQSIEDEKVNWSAIADRAGYSDQSHLSREFSSLIGSSPATYEAFRKRSIRYGSMNENL